MTGSRRRRAVWSERTSSGPTAACHDHSERPSRRGTTTTCPLGRTWEMCRPVSNPWATQVRPQRPAEACQSYGCRTIVDWPQHAPRAHRDTTKQHETTPGWTHGGGRATPPCHPKPSPITLSHSACRPELETGGRGEGGQSRSPGAGQREWDLPIPAPGVDRPMHIGAGRRLFRRSPSNAAVLTVLGRAPQAVSFTGPKAVWVRR